MQIAGFVEYRLLGSISTQQLLPLIPMDQLFLNNIFIYNCLLSIQVLNVNFICAMSKLKQLNPTYLEETGKISLDKTFHPWKQHFSLIVIAVSGPTEHCPIFHFPPSSVRHRRDISTFLYILTVYTMKTIYFLNAYHLGW